MGIWRTGTVCALILSSTGAAFAQGAGNAQPYLHCEKRAKQGGAITCRTEPFARLALDGVPVARADADGFAILGLSRTQVSPAMVTFAIAAGETVSDDRRYMFSSVEIAPRSDTVSRFKMTCARIEPQSPQDQRHADISWVKKEKALKVFHEPSAPLSLVSPATGPYSSPYGAVRTYVPETKDCEGRTSVHNGQDIAIATGTQIRAPMSGAVLLADPDLFYEGGAVFLDMGRGLVSVTMHMSRVDVANGQVVAQGDPLGLSGATGRVTGPHLHWGIKYRNPLSEDRGADLWLDPAILMELTSIEQVAASE